MAYAAKKIRRFEDCIDAGERLRLRNPSHLKNLILLVEVYVRVKKNVRAKTIMEEGFHLDPKKPSLLKIKSILDGKFSENS